MNFRQTTPFVSRTSPGEKRALMVYLILHVSVMPMLISFVGLKAGYSETEVNFIYYAFGVAYMLAMCMGYLRRDFDPLCDRPLFCMFEVLTGYFVLLCMNYCATYIIFLIVPEFNNPNNNAVVDLINRDSAMMKVTLIFLAPVVEELLFRGGLFGIFREQSRLAAYLISVLGFALYHVMNYLVFDWRNIIFLLQYIPAGLMLCRCYERTGSIWCCIFFHMAVNGIAFNTMETMM